MIENIRKEVKALEEKKISLLDMEIVYEMDWTILGHYNITPKEYETLFYEIRYAYLKLDVDLHCIVRCALDNKDKIINDDKNFSLREESCYY